MDDILPLLFRVTGNPNQTRVAANKTVRGAG
jgi:hypothetical protein